MDTWSRSRKLSFVIATLVLVGGLLLTPFAHPARSQADEPPRPQLGGTIRLPAEDVPSRPNPAPQRRPATPLKAIAIVGDAGTNTAAYKLDMESAATALESHGVTVTRFYYGNTTFTWSNIVAASQDATFLLYMGSGVYYGGTIVSPTLVGGFYLGNNEFVSPSQIANDLTGRVTRPSFAILSHGAYMAGSAGADPGTLPSSEAARRVQQYADPFIQLGMNAYFANNHDGSAANAVHQIFAQAAMGEVFKSDTHYIAANLQDLTHPTSGYDLWLDGTPGNWHLAFVGHPLYQYSDNFTLYVPTVLRNHYVPCLFNDPDYMSYQYSMAQIRADDAWDHCIQGNANLTVAVIDTGINLGHPDLVDNLLPGYDFIDNDSTPEDTNGHGSNVAGIIGAPINGIGIIGVAPKIRLLPVRVLNTEGSGTYSQIANGIRWAADRAAILNLSLSGPLDSYILRDAINYAVDTQQRLVIAAAGNCGDPLNYRANGCSQLDEVRYPAAYDNVLSVAAVDRYDDQASFSNQNDYVDIAAPGVQIYSTYRSGLYAYQSGTSQAAPHVSGLAALIWYYNPQFNAAQVRDQLEATAVDLGTPGKDPQFGIGRIDAVPALRILVAARRLAEPAPLALQVLDENRHAPFVSGRVLLKFRPEMTAAATRNLLAGLPEIRVTGEIQGLAVKILNVPAGEEWQWVDQLRKLPGVLYAEPDYRIQLSLPVEKAAP